MEWRNTLAGWQILVPDSVLPKWRGADGFSDLDDDTHYARLCRTDGCVYEFLGKPVLIFGGSVGQVAWMPSLTSPHIGDAFMWDFADSETQLLEGIQDVKAKDFDESIIHIPAVGETLRHMIDPTDPGNDLREGSLEVHLPNVPLQIQPGYVDRDRFAFYFWRISRVSA